MNFKFAYFLGIALVWQAHAQTSGNWTQQSPKASPPARDFPGMAYDSGHSQVVMFGGHAVSASFAQTYFNDTWVWDGSNWTQKSPLSSPSPRYGETVAYDAVHGQVVLFGGQDANFNILGDTWVWDGSNWTEKSPPTSPPARTGHAMAYDAAHGQVVVFGGGNAVTAFADTWVWDGSNWTQKSPQTSPTETGGAVMVYDGAHNNVVLFGGDDANGNALNTTWIWDGVNWTQKMLATTPPGRVNFAMAYDAAHDQVVMFGGLFNTASTFGEQIFDDTWLWDGAQWTKESPQTQPPESERHGMAYDSVHGQVVLFGGFLSTDTWTWTGAIAAPVPTITSIISASGFGGFSSVAPGSWVEIYGSNLAPDTRQWAGSDFSGNNAPTALDGVQVTIGGQKAFVEYISSTGQVNAQLPSNITAGGPLGVTVTNGTQTTAAFNVNVNSAEPGLLAPASFLIGGKQYAVGILSDGSYAFPAGAIAGVASRPAHPGESIILYGVGFGPVMPPINAGQIATVLTQIVAPLQIFFGQTAAAIQYDGLTPASVGLYQFNLTVPAVPDNDLVPITFTLGGVAGTQTLYLAVHQ
jgi:uncharacterized protein (TIGR03437 family)